MAQHHISASRIVQAPAQQVYDLLADYHEGHPRILPRPPFISLTVEEGGKGEGTVLNVEMKVLGRVQTYHATVTEPEPGRVLVEHYADDSITSFTVEPHDDGRKTSVTIATDLQIREGALGTLQARLATRLLRPLYLKELDQLNAAVSQSVMNRQN